MATIKSRLLALKPLGRAEVPLEIISVSELSLPLVQPAKLLNRSCSTIESLTRNGYGRIESAAERAEGSAGSAQRVLKAQ